MSDIDKLLAENMSEWWITLPSSEMASQIMEIPDAVIRFLDGDTGGEGTCFANPAEWQTKAMNKLLEDNDACDLANYAIEYTKRDGAVICGRFAALHCLGPVISMALDAYDIDEPLVFDSISTIHSEGAIVAVGRKGWNFADTRKIAENYDFALLSLILDVSGEKQAMQIAERGRLRLWGKIESEKKAATETGNHLEQKEFNSPRFR